MTNFLLVLIIIFLIRLIKEARKDSNLLSQLEYRVINLEDCLFDDDPEPDPDPEEEEPNQVTLNVVDLQARRRA